MNYKEIDKTKFYVLNEVLAIFREFGLPSSRASFFSMKKDGTIPEKYLSLFTKGKHIRIKGDNLIKLLKEL